VPLPAWVRPPLPLMVPPSVVLPATLDSSVPLLVTSPTIEPVAPPLPSCSVPPALMVVPPV
jgi:hypothetical protein